MQTRRPVPCAIPLTATLAALLLGAAFPPPQSSWVERQTVRMGTRLRVAVRHTSRAEGLAAIQAAFSEIVRVERLLSTWDPDTELARANRAPVGHATPISDELADLLDEVRTWSERTDGAFDPTVGPLIDVWGLRRRPQPAAPDDLAAARAASGWRQFQFDRARRTLTRHTAAAWIDSGGFGKGYALRRVRDQLIHDGVIGAVVDFGGQILVVGDVAEGRATIAVAHPQDRDAATVHLLLQRRSAATSGLSERSASVGADTIGHILDPRTGRPVPPWGSVTVIAADPLVADILATALMVRGPTAPTEWDRLDPGIGVLVLDSATDPPAVRANRHVPFASRAVDGTTQPRVTRSIRP